MPKARQAAQKALSLDTNLAEAHTALGRVLLTYDHDFVGAEREFLRAIELNPNLAIAHSRYGGLLTVLGKFEPAQREHRRAIDIEPLSPPINLGFASMLINGRRYDEAITHIKKTLELDEGFFLAHSLLARAYHLKRNYPASVEEQARASETFGREQQAAGFRESFERGGWEGYLRFRLTELRPDLSYEIATIYVELGEKDKAFAALNTAYENRENLIPSIKVDPQLDPLRDDPRFDDLIRKIGFPE
jgi:tetratricopeptide (TPR) repeat protein